MNRSARQPSPLRRRHDVDAVTPVPEAPPRRTLCPAPGADIVSIRTETGSRYTIDLGAGTWSRVPSLRSGVLRSESGPIVALHLVGLGAPAVLECPPLVAGSIARYVVTSTVVALDETRTDDASGPGVGAEVA